MNIHVTGARIGRQLVVIATAALLNAMTVMPAQAATLSAGPGHPAQLPQSQMRQATPNSVGSSNNAPVSYYNWSGYAATSTNRFVSVRSDYTQPTVTCPVPGAWTLFWVGFDGFRNNTVEQAGTAAQCDYSTNPKPTYYAWWEMWPTNNIQIAPMTVMPGDTIQAEVDYQATSNNYMMSVKDKKQQFTQVSACASNLYCGRESAEWIVERTTLNGSYTPLADWNTMTLTRNKAADTAKTSGNPRYLPAGSFNSYQINMVGYSGTTLATPSNSRGNLKTFTDTWSAAQ